MKLQFGWFYYAEIRTFITVGIFNLPKFNEFAVFTNAKGGKEFLVKKFGILNSKSQSYEMNYKIKFYTDFLSSNKLLIEKGLLDPTFYIPKTHYIYFFETKHPVLTQNEF